MILVVDPHSGVPVFRQLIEQIRFHVASGLLEPGDEIPSTRTLAVRLGVNPMTVSKAFGILVDEGVILRRPGLPLVVASQESASLEADRLNHLRSALGGVVTMVRQLNLSDEDAVRVLRDLLAESKDSSR